MLRKDGETLSGLARRAVDENGKAMSLGYLSDLASGKRRPPARIVKRLASVLNVPVSMLEPRMTNSDVDLIGRSA